MAVWLCLASRQNVIKRTPAPTGRNREGGGMEARDGGEGGVHRCCQNVIKPTRAPAGRERDRGEGGRDGCVIVRFIDYKTDDCKRI